MKLATLFTEPDALAMRRTMGRFLTGVAVVTTRSNDGGLHGMTINSLTSISLEPPILMISLNFGTRTGDALLESGKFAISILGAKQESVARRFAVRGGERFDGGEFDVAGSGLPVIRGALSQADCEVVNQYDIGDHQVFFGQVTGCRDRDGQGLAFNAGKFGSFKDFGHQELPWIF
ncbi:flavin reductase family protein [Arthrobacter mobilis]|uniref:Flavin reductase family protein n=1 Tax=Arthrobacter mobilis TaxID=2724944 RepID=A0A7X6HHF1_9MICC|nr:flavin reductase family protein [Arthrobacter mobilis]NKX55742.1 flavin reductase family protein [Arthrobacter mobilis]